MERRGGTVPQKSRATPPQQNSQACSQYYNQMPTHGGKNSLPSCSPTTSCHAGAHGCLAAGLGEWNSQRTVVLEF